MKKQIGWRLIMRKELDEALCAKYPLIFGDRHKPMTQTAMCWGFSCGDGWYNIIDTLCGMLTSKYRQAKSRYDYLAESGVGGILYGTKTVTQEDLDKAKANMEEEAAKVPVASQVKEKFGGLRFYVQAATDEHYNYISFAESMSYRTCEVCGAPGERYTDGWHQTLCEVHAKEDGREKNEDDGDE
jgi:hypothetical protein